MKIAEAKKLIDRLSEAIRRLNAADAAKQFSEAVVRLTEQRDEATGSGTQECEECESLEEAIRVVTEIKNELQADLATTRTALQNAQEALREQLAAAKDYLAPRAK